MALSPIYFPSIFLVLTINVLEIPACIDHLSLLSTNAKVWNLWKFHFDLMPYRDCSEKILCFKNKKLTSLLKTNQGLGTTSRRKE